MTIKNLFLTKLWLGSSELFFNYICPSEPSFSQGTTPWGQVVMLRDFLFVTLVDPVGGDPPLQLSA